MYLKLALLSAFGVAIFNGTAAVLEKITADKQKRANKLRFSFLFRLFSDLPFVVGIILDTFAWVFTLIAVHTLPLFVAQPIFAFGVVVTVLVELFILHKKFKWHFFLSIGIIFLGLVLVASTATPEKAYVVDYIFKWSIWLAPALLALLSSFTVRYNTRIANISLGALSGIAFGGTSITGRMLVFHHPFWRILAEPTFWSLAAYGIVGLLTFTVALQRHNASIINAASVTFNTIFPLLIGVFFLGDQPRHHEWLQVGIGITLALAGSVIISLSSDTNKRLKIIATTGAAKPSL